MVRFFLFFSFHRIEAFIKEVYARSRCTIGGTRVREKDREQGKRERKKRDKERGQYTYKKNEHVIFLTPQ